MVAPRDLEQPLLEYSAADPPKSGIRGKSGCLSKHLGTDAQSSAWIIFIVTFIIFAEQAYHLYVAQRYFLSSASYVLGTFIGCIGCWLFVKSSYPDQIVASCFYSNNSIAPPPGSWFLRVHFGTRVLRGGQFQLIGAILYAFASAIWIQEDYLYRKLEGTLTDADDTWEYFGLVFACFLLLSGAYYQLLSQYPQSVLLKAAVPSTWLATDTQVSGWFFETLSVLWLLRSAITFDASFGDETIDVPLAAHDWSALADCCLASALAVGSYFILAQSYREGTRMDAVLVQQAARASSFAAPDSPIVPTTGSGKTVPVNRKTAVHPLADVTDLTDSRAVLRKARKLASKDTPWVPAAAGSAEDIRVWMHGTAHAVRFETSRFRSIDPLLLAGVIQSEAFKTFQLAARSGSSVNVVGKLGLVTGDSMYTSQATIFHERFPPNPPMPAHESTFASLLNEARRTDVAEVVEWAVDSTGLRAMRPVGAAGPNTSTPSSNSIKVNPFRYFSVSASGVLTVAVWLEDIARWMPDFLLRAEMAKVPMLVTEIEAFFSQAEPREVQQSLSTWIWQKVHNSVSPLSASVLVRTSPAYRVLLAKHPGLRTRVPDVVSVPVGALGHPLEHFPSILGPDSDVDVAVATKHASDFISNEFGSWHLSDDYKAKSGKPKITVWRQEMEGETVRPFRIQARIHGVDPLTLALLIHRNKLGDLVQDSSTVGTAGKSIYAPSPLQSQQSAAPGDRTPDPLRSRNRLSAPGSSPEKTGSMMGDDPEFGGVTVSNTLIGTLQEGAVRVYRERIRRTKYMPTARDREFTFASMMRDVSPLKAVVVHFGTNFIGDIGHKDESDSGVVRLRKFNAFALENDGGNDTKLTWCGLIPVGGRAEKMSAWLSSGRELKQKLKFVEKLVSVFATDSDAKDAVAEAHQYIAYNAIRTAIHRELRKLSIAYLSGYSEDYKMLLSEIQPVVGGMVGLEGSLRTPEKVSDDDSGSDVTVPLSPVESHLRMSLEDDDDEVRTQKNGELEDDEDMIPDERNTR